MRKTNWRRGGIAVAAIAAVLLAGCSGAAPDDKEKVLRLSGGITANWNPFDGAYGNEAVYDPLIAVAAEGAEPEPWLAKSFDLSADGLTLKVKLRDDVDFIDGTHMDAAGVAKYFDALFADPDYTWKLRIVDEFGTKVEATGEYDLTITTTLPISSRWYWQFGLTPVASPAGVDDPSIFTDGPVGSGPYLIDEVVPDVSVRYVRNPHYWNADRFPYDVVEIKQYADPVAALNAIKTGQLDAAQVDLSLASEAESSGLRVTTGIGFIGTLYVADFAGKVFPALGDVRVRQALNMAFDRAGILKNLNFGYGNDSSQPFSEGQPEWVPGEDDHYPFDVERAKQLLTEAGYPDGFDITIPVFSGSGFGIFDVPQYQDLVISSLAAIGINVTLESYGGDFEPYRDMLASGKVPLILINMPATNWTAVWGDWFPPLDDPQLVALLDTQKTGTPSEQVDAAHEIGEYLLEQAWFVPFSRPGVPIVSVKDVTVEISGAITNPKLWQYAPAA